jgi:uroporphyrinogen III methyltransferase/synthase
LILENSSSMSFLSAKVYLIGAGPGDPGLITLKGVRALARADVVVHDHLVHPRVLEHARPDARRVFAGKRPGLAHRTGGRYGMSQAAINRLMIREARRGRVVARVKGGDPFVFGRGGEEALALAAARIPFEVVPGVTAVIGAPAYAGIPVTHRGAASGFALVTGHEDPGKGAPEVDWTALARFRGTIGIYMAARRLDAVAGALMAGGKPPDTPAAVIERGTWPGQRTIVAPLGTIARKARAARIEPPAMVVIGSAVRLRQAIAWFEGRPLAGRRVVVTRAAERAPELAQALEDAGANVTGFPAIALAPPHSWRDVDRAIEDLRRSGWKSAYSWVVFLSAAGVERFLGRVGTRGGDARTLAGCRIAAIGPATARALEARGLRPDVTAADATSEGLSASLRGRIGRGDRVLMPRTDIGRELLPDALRRAGAVVDEVTVYRTIPARGGDVAAMRRALARGEVDALTFASARTAQNFAAAVGRAAIRRMARRVKVVSIGPVTSAACRSAGLRVSAQARTPSLAGLVEAAARAVGRRG